MFEEISKKEPAPANLTSPPATGAATEDIFAEVDQEKPAAFQPKTPASPPAGGGISEPTYQADDSKKFFVLGIIVISLMVIFAGGFYGYKKFIKSKSVDLNQAGQLPTETETTEPGQPAAPAATEISTTTTASESVSQPSDTDQDGLTDEEERQLGTNPNSIDSDGDGLYDREEVKVYDTDPLAADSDGDGFSDGQEVSSGYNPKGSGRLYEL